MPLSRLLVLTAAFGIIAGPGWAQPLAGDPPARVGRLAALSGTVSYHLAGADRWETAVLNLPVTTGSAFWTEPGAHAEIGVAGNRIALDQSSEFEFVRLDDQALLATEAQGDAYLHLRDVPRGNLYSIQTPRGTVTIATTGRYEVVAGDAGHPTTITVLEGAAQVVGPNVALQVGPAQTATITGDGAPFQASVGPAVRSPFLLAMLAGERPAARRPLPPVVERMTGTEDLEQYGEWASTPEYGTVWYPRADAGFVPYRNGHWAFVQPWGWTWVDDAAWGFAPSHYGRWVQVADRWGWTPLLLGARVADPYPVYAPAVVGFLAGAVVGAVVEGGVGWVPLGPREPYFPPYRVSNTYVRRVNITNVVNVNTAVNIYNQSLRPGVPPSRPTLLNLAAASVAPQAAMLGSQGMAPLARPIPPASVQAATPVIGRPPLLPAPQTRGVTPALARQLGLPPGAEAGRPAAPGPGFGRAPLRQVAEPSGLAPAQPRPDAGLIRPAVPLPVPGAATGAPPVRSGQPGAPGPAILARPGLAPPGAVAQGPDLAAPPRGAPAFLAPRPTAPEATTPQATVLQAPVPQATAPGAIEPVRPHAAPPFQAPPAHGPGMPPRSAMPIPGAMAPSGAPRPGQATAPGSATPLFAPRAPSAPPTHALPAAAAPEFRHPAAPTFTPQPHLAPPPMPQRPAAPPPQRAPQPVPQRVPQPAPQRAPQPAPQRAPQHAPEHHDPRHPDR